MKRIKDTGCCPRFDPKPWDNKVFEWNKKKFIKDKVFTLFYIPMNFGSVIKRMMGKVARIKGNTPDWMALSDHTSKWNMDLYLAVDKIIPKANNVTLSGKFLSKVYEGPFKDTGKWMEDFKKNAKKKGYKVLKDFMWYTTCPKCAKAYGENYVVVIAPVREIEEKKSKVVTKKPKAKKVSSKTASSKKRKVVSKKKTVKKVPSKKATTKKVTSKKSTVKKTTKKVATKKATVKKKASKKKASSKKTTKKAVKKVAKKK